MAKIKTWAAGINNLSDARYFAAMGVDIVSFSLGEGTAIAPIVEMRNWIEGPLVAIDVQDIVWSQQLSDDITALAPDLVVLSPFWADEIPQLEAEVVNKLLLSEYTNRDNPTLILIVENRIDSLSNKDITLLSNLTLQHNNIYLDTAIDAAIITYLQSQFEEIGIILRGGDELAVGLKSFDELDELFDLINDY